MEKISQAVSYIQQKCSVVPEVGLILGSGLGVAADLVENEVRISYEDIPHFPVSTVEGHEGELLLGTLAGRPVVMMKGRFHMYEGYTPEVTTFPIRVMKMLGVRSLLVTNAAGGVNTSYEPGDLMLITDHLNLTGMNPLIGPNEDTLGVRFPDMSEAYSSRLRQLAKQKSIEQQFKVQEGVYAGLLGPSYETPAEIKMLRMLGADAVGMSTVSEVIAARHSNLEVLAISCISNMAAGVLNQPLSHSEVIETTSQIKDKFLSLVLAVIPQM